MLRLTGAQREQASQLKLAYFRRTWGPQIHVDPNGVVSRHIAVTRRVADILLVRDTQTHKLTQAQK